MNEKPAYLKHYTKAELQKLTHSELVDFAFSLQEAKNQSIPNGRGATKSSVLNGNASFSDYFYSFFTSLEKNNKISNAQKKELMGVIEKLLEENMFWKMLFEQSLGGCFIMMIDKPIEWNENTDKDKTLDYVFINQKLTHANKAFLNQYKAAESDFVGATPKDFYSHDIDYGKKVWRDFFDNGVLHVRTKEKKFNGEEMWIEGDYICFYDKSGNIKGHFGIQIDITEHINTINSLKRSEERLSFVLDGNGDGAWEWNIETGETFFSKQWKNMIGFKEEDEIDNFDFWASSIHPDDLPATTKILNDHLNRKTDFYSAEFRMRCADGTYKWILTRGRILNYSTDGKPLKMFGTHTDISKRKWIEKNNQTHRNLLNSIVDNVPIGLWLKNLDGKIIFVNKYLRTLLNNNLDLLKIIDNNFCLEESEYHFTEETIKLPNHSKYIFKTIRKKILDSENQMYAYLGITLDITESKMNEERINQINENLQALINTKDKFFSIIAHDLKNPFNTLLGFSELLINEYDEYNDHIRKELIGHIFESAKQGQNLLINLLEWALSQTGSIKYSPTYIDVASLITDNMKLFEANANKKNIQILSQSNIENLYAFADLNMINTVVRNLLSNALKFTNKGGKVTVNYGIVENNAVIRISDTGIGIAKDDLMKLFRLDVTHSTFGTSNEKGTGLGLILCKEFIEKNFGEIFVESEVGKGSTFTILLPLDKSFIN